MARKKKPVVKYPMMEILQIACAVQRVKGEYIGTVFGDSNKQLIINQLNPETKNELYEIADEDKKTADNCVTHFQNLAIKYLADTINQFEMSLYLFITSEEIEESAIGYLALMPSKYQTDTEREPMAKALRMSNGPITCNEGDKLSLTCKVVNTFNVVRHGFWSITAITNENNAIVFTCSRDYFQIGAEYHISGRVVSPSVPEYHTQLPCTKLNYVKVTAI